MGHRHGDGDGMIQNSLGDTFKGQVVNDIKEGEGEMNFADGRVFQRRFKQDKAIKGTLIFSDRGKDIGKNGPGHGQGVHWFVDESKCEGQPVMNIFEIKGKMTWTDGGWFEDEWLQGKILGYGTERQADGPMGHKRPWSIGVPI
jgi:hypothetical protein